MKTQILILAMAVGAGLAITPAYAQGHDTADFATLDTDGDGQITLEDFEASRTARFEAADTDGNGVLSEAELTAQAQARQANRAADMVAKMVERLDANGDGVLALEELQDRRGDRMERRFERADANDDGAISEEEFDAAAKERGGRGHRGGKGHGPRPGRG